MNRRDFLKRCACIAAGGVLSERVLADGVVLSGPTLEVSIGAKHLNVVLFLVDNMGWVDMEYSQYWANGSQWYETPNMTRLAGQGMIFTDHYTTSPVCSPTRCSLMTGKSPARTDLTQWIKGQNKYNVDWTWKMLLSEVTIAEALKAEGYSTCHIGKWHLGDGSAEADPLNQSFDINIGGSHWGRPYGGYFSPYNMPNLPDGPDGEYLTDRLKQEALQYLDTVGDTPFFLNMWLYSVHAPPQAKQSYIDYFNGKAPDPTGRHSNATYAAMLKSVDECLGAIMDKLEEMGLADKTIIIFISDNGGLLRSGITSNSPLKGGMGQKWDGGTRVPAIVKAPGVPNGAISNVVASCYDWYPTILELTGVAGDPSHNANVDGESLVPVLRGTGSLSREAIYVHYPHNHGQADTPHAWIRKGNYKLIQNLKVDSDVSIELYKVGPLGDYDEDTDLSGSNPTLAESLRNELHCWLQSVDGKVPPGFTLDCQ